jgi:transposase InsO family protein
VALDFKLACAKLDIRISYATPYHPAGKGSIEKFWQFVQSDFLPELRLHPVSENSMNGILHGLTCTTRRSMQPMGCHLRRLGTKCECTNFYILEIEMKLNRLFLNIMKS